jgi:hypothetical protein
MAVPVPELCGEVFEGDMTKQMNEDVLGSSRKRLPSRYWAARMFFRNKIRQPLIGFFPVFFGRQLTTEEAIVNMRNNSEEVSCEGNRENTEAT